MSDTLPALAVTNRMEQEQMMEDLAEVARMLRTVVEALPPRSARDRAAVRRVEGAAVALETLAHTRG